jgi:hypothetical protein
MPTVSSGDLTLLRSEKHKNELRLSFLVPPILWKARVNDGSIVKGETGIDFDQGTGSHFGKIEGLQEVWVGSTDGADDIGRLRIKSISSGDGGVTGTVTVAGHSLPVGDNYYLTFLHDYPLKPRFSYIDPGTENWYMDDDVSYSDQHQEPPPVGIAGPHRAAYLDEVSGDVVFNVDSSDSYAIANGASISSYSLSVTSTAATATVNFNTGTGLGNITFDTPGFYWAKYGVTDSNGKTQYTYRCYIIHDPDLSQNEYPWIDCETVQLEADWENGGWTCGVRAQDNALLTDIPDHALCIVWQEAIYNETRKHITYLPDQNSAVFIGYVREDSLTQEMQPGYGDVDLTLSTIDGRLRRLFSFSTSLIAAKGTPSEWYQYENWQTIGTIVHDLFLWRSTLMSVADVFGLTDSSLKRMFQAFDEGNIYDNANNFTYNEGIRAKILCDQGGRLHLSEDQQLMIDSDRAGLTTMFPLIQTAGIADYGNAFAIQRRQEFEAPFVTANGIYWDGNTWDDDDRPFANGEYCSIAPGGKPHWDGPDPQDFPKQTVLSQDHLNQITGRYLAKVNNEVPEVTVEFHGSYNTVLDIAYSEQYTISLQASETIRGISWSNKPLYCRHIQAIYDARLGSWEVNASFEPESLGDDGVTTECPSFPELGGEIPPLELPGDVPGALLTGASVNYKGAQTDLWVQRLTQDVKDLIDDPYWRSRQSSSAPSKAIVLRCGVGYIKRSTDGFDTVDVNVTPSTDPPNDAGDSPAPTATSVTYRMLDSSVVTQGRFVALANWQNSVSEWRSWLVYTANDGTSWSWQYLGASVSGCTPEYESDVGVDWTDSCGAPSAFGPLTYAWVDTDIFVLIGDNISLGCFATAFKVSGGTITAGGRVTLSPVTTIWSFPSIAKADTLKFCALYKYGSGSGNRWYMRAGTVNSSTLAITLGTERYMMTADEYAWHVPGNTPEGDGKRQIAQTGTDSLIVYGLVSPFTWNGDDDCEPDNTIHGMYIVPVTLSGTTITVATTSCNTETITDWTTVVDYHEEGAPALFNHYLTECGDGTHYWLSYFSFNNTSNYSEYLYVACGTGTTVGTAVKVSTINRNISFQHEFLPMSTTKAIIIWIEYDATYTYTIIKAALLTRSGTTVTVDSEQTLFDPSIANPSTELNPFDPWLYQIDSDEFGLVFWDGDEGYTCAAMSILRATVNLTSGTMVVDDICNRWLDYNTNCFILSYSSSYFIHMENLNQEAYLRDVYFSCLAGGEALGLGLGIGRSSGNKVWVTIGNGTTLELLEVALPGLTISQRISLGSASISEVVGRDYLAYPYIPFGYDDAVYVFGRMNDPQSLGNPAHVIRTINGGTSFTLIENGWGFDYCGAYRIGLDGVSFAIRNQANKATLYKDNADSNLLVKVTLPFDAPVSPHGMYINLVLNDLYIGSWQADSVMVVKLGSPYLTWTDLTFNHDSTEGIESVLLL